MMRRKLSVAMGDKLNQFRATADLDDEDDDGVFGIVLGRVGTLNNTGLGGSSVAISGGVGPRQQTRESRHGGLRRSLSCLTVSLSHVSLSGSDRGGYSQAPGLGTKAGQTWYDNRENDQRMRGREQEVVLSEQTATGGINYFLG